MEFISTQALVLKAFIDSIKTELPDTFFIYDEMGDFTAAITRARAENMKQKKTNITSFFSFNRSVLRTSQYAPSDRSRLFKIAEGNLASQAVKLYKTIFAEFDVNFTYFSNNARDIEIFEILYLARDGIFKDKLLYVNTEKLIGFNLEYVVMLQDLNDKRFELDGLFYKSVSGAATIRGFYPILKGNDNIIKEINLEISNFESSLMQYQKITS